MVNPDDIREARNGDERSMWRAYDDAIEQLAKDETATDMAQLTPEQIEAIYHNDAAFTAWENGESLATVLTILTQ